jgi:hypothetical protein
MKHFIGLMVMLSVNITLAQNQPPEGQYVCNDLVLGANGFYRYQLADTFEIIGGDQYHRTVTNSAGQFRLEPNGSIMFLSGPYQDVKVGQYQAPQKAEDRPNIILSQIGETSRDSDWFCSLEP